MFKYVKFDGIRTLVAIKTYGFPQTDDEKHKENETKPPLVIVSSQKFLIFI